LTPAQSEPVDHLRREGGFLAGDEQKERLNHTPDNPNNTGPTEEELARKYRPDAIKTAQRYCKQLRKERQYFDQDDIESDAMDIVLKHIRKLSNPTTKWEKLKQRAAAHDNGVIPYLLVELKRRHTQRRQGTEAYTEDPLEQAETCVAPEGESNEEYLDSLNCPLIGRDRTLLLRVLYKRDKETIKEALERGERTNANKKEAVERWYSNVKPEAVRWGKTVGVWLDDDFSE
jgi:hypothetical protein